jgi:hypothetical protein
MTKRFGELEIAPSRSLMSDLSRMMPFDHERTDAGECFLAGVGTTFLSPRSS